MTLGGDMGVTLCGYGSKLNHQGTAGLSPCFHLPGFYIGCLFLTHTQGVTWVTRAPSTANPKGQGGKVNHTNPMSLGDTMNIDQGSATIEG